REAVADQDFAKGLLLSSDSLSSSLRRYLAGPAGRSSAKVRQIERSLLRYLSRMAMKATPFSLFCSLLPGSLTADGASQSEAAPAFSASPRRKTSVLRLDKSIYGRLIGRLTRRAEIRRHLPLELNSTVQREGERWLFLTARGHQEVFQRLAHNAVLSVLSAALEARTPQTLGELAANLAGHPDVDASLEEAVAYLDRLVEIGLLRFRLGIPEQEVHWDEPLAALLAPIDDPQARRVVSFLGELRELMESYSLADAPGRAELLRRATALVPEVMEELEPDSGYEAKHPFYEDAGGEASLNLDLAEVEPVLLEYARLSAALAYPRSEQANLRHFFESFYGEAVTSLPLLRFYEDYYREHFKQHLDRQKGAEAAAEKGDYDLFNPFGLEILERLDRGGERLRQLLRERIEASPDAEEIRLEREDLEAATGGIPELPESPRSLSFFVQYLGGPGIDGSRPALLARNYMSGYGKYFSRFLYLLPERVLADLQASNRELSREKLVEICGDANFNANLHPPLMPHELSYPTGESTGHPGELRSADLRVARDPESAHQLALFDSEGARVYPVDLGFLNPRLRPPLFQLLSRFTPATHFTLPMPEISKTETGAEGADLAARTIYALPRLTYRGRIVLARRQWSLGREAFPRRLPQQDEAAYFLSVQSWRGEHGLPEEVFCRIHALPSQGDEPEGAKRPRAPMRQHLYKPQFIDFSSPLLVDLLTKTLETLDNFALTFEERLPAKEHLVGHGEELFATELILQADFPQAREPASRPEAAA
ncbi:MAG: lantibiotic dehydratase, partial [Acidobacteriota bacterium]